MTSLSGSNTVDIDAPIERCWAIINDPDGTAEWQASVKRTVVVERNGEGDPVLVESAIDAIAREIKVVLRFEGDEPHELRWRRESGDLKTCDGAWRLEDLGGGRTRATYELALDPGRVLSMLVRGPLADQLRKHLTKQPPEGLKRVAEAGG